MTPRTKPKIVTPDDKPKNMRAPNPAPVKPPPTLALEPAFTDENRPISRQFGQMERIEEFIRQYEILCQNHGIEIRPELYFKPQPDGTFGIGTRLVAITVGGPD